MKRDFFRFKYKIKYFLNVLKKNIGHGKLGINYDNSIIFLLACDYNNVGDALIRFAQEEFIKQNTHKKNIVTIGLHDTMRFLKDIKNNATQNTIIVLTGGGNTDDRYTEMERVRNYIVKLLRKNNCRIIGFPQTIDYSDTNRGKYYAKKARESYFSNSNFNLIAREKRSFDFAKNYFSGTKVFLMPDIALSHPIVKTRQKRSGIGLLMRSDEEKALDDRFLNEILSCLMGHKLYKNDMTVNSFDKNNLKEYVIEKIDFVSRRKIVLTDRLHGMIICYITNTPCIVFPSANHKIFETYKNWLSGKQNFIKIVYDTDIKKILKDIESLNQIKTIKKDSLLPFYEKLTKLLSSR